MAGPSGDPFWRDAGSKVAAVLAAYLVLRLVQFLFERRRAHQTFKRMRVPGPEPKLLSGQLYETRRQAYVKFAHKMHQRYGQTVGIFLGGDPFLLTTDLELIQQVFVAKSRVFYDRMNFYLNVDPVPDNLICQRGERWRYMRKLLTPAFSNTKIKSSQFYRDAQRTVEKFMGQLEANSSLESKEGADCVRATKLDDVYDRMAAVALDVIVKTAFHMDDVISFDGPTMTRADDLMSLRRGKTDSLEPQVNRPEPRDAFLSTAKRACRLGFNPLVELIFCFPFLDAPLTYLCNHVYFGSIIKLLFARLDQLVKRPPAAGGGVQRKRIIDSLIEVLRERCITRSEFTGNAFVIVFAGFETTANALTFTLYLLAKHQRVQEKLRSELRERLASINERGQQLEQEQRLDLELVELAQGCQYLEMVINESLRLYPPVPGLSCRQASESCCVGTANGLLTIERGVNVIPSVYSIHRDKRIWGQNAAEFQPERFELLDLNQLNSAMFMPFGLGPRNCIGKAAALHELKIVIGRLCLEYSIEPCDQLTPAKLKLCSPINITITNSEPIGLKFVKLNA